MQRTFLIAPVVALGLVVHAPSALACGGLFSPPSQPVDQTAERILFEVQDDGSVMVTVEILYSGDASSFSWIIPIEGRPDFVEVADPNILKLLDQATQPTVLPPTQGNSCYGGDGFGFGCLPGPPYYAEAASIEVGVDGFEAPSTVNVHGLAPVGPYDDIVVVDSSDPEALIGWLNDNGYPVSDAMRPVIENYGIEGKKFLAVRLAPTAGTSDIVPVRFLCRNAFPTLPARITSVAAAPEMSFLIFVAADQRYGSLNYGDIEVRGDEINPYNFNYYQQISRRVDESGGRAFITERAQPSSTIRGLVAPVAVLNNAPPSADGTTPGMDVTKEALGEVLARHAYITRMYTRINPEEMTEDPMFVAVDKPDFDGVIDQSTLVFDSCGAGPRPCASTYCGNDSACATTESSIDGCVCGTGMVARQIPGGSGVPTVFCQANINMHDEDALNACFGFDCGAGTCHNIGGAPTCACDEGFAAVVDLASARGVRCVRAIDTFGAGSLDVPADARAQPTADEPAVETRDGGCTASAAGRDSGLATIATMFSSVAIGVRILRRRR
jgi:hypothetical protein